MANSFTFDDACTLLGGWYHRMRVENLADDEVLNELKARKVILNQHLTNDQRREMLKNRLAQEQSGEAEIGLRYVIGPPEDEIATCTDRYELLKTLMTPDVDEERRNIVQDRLIHLGIRLVAVLRVSRGSPNLHGSLQNMVVELTSLLYAFYEEPPQEPEPPTVPNPPVPIPLKEVGSLFTQDDLDYMHDLQARIAHLEGQLAFEAPVREMGTQTPKVTFS